MMTEKRKIAFVCHPYHRGGVTRWMADAAIAYSNNGYDVYFVTPEPSKEFFSGKGRETMLQLLQKKKHNIHIGSIKAGVEFEFGLPEYNIYVYKQLIKEHIPVGTPIILSDDKFVWQAAAAMHSAYPVVGVLHADEAHYYELAKKHHKSVDIFVCVSERVSKNVRGECPEIPGNTLFVIPCGIELAPAETIYRQNSILQLVYVGRIADYQKRTGDVIKIAEKLKNISIPYRLNIIGDGLEPKQVLMQRVKAAGLEQEVTFTGWLSQAKVHEYLISADVLLLTSDFEGMPISMMEGLAAGCGFAGTRVSGIEDYENHPLAKDCFRVFDVGDIDDAVKKIRQLQAIPLQARKQAARQLAESQFSMATCLENYNKAIATIPVRKYEPVTISISPAIAIQSRLVAIARNLKMRWKSAKK